MMDWDGSWGAGSWLAMSLMMLVVWAGPIALVVWLVRSSFHPGQRPDTAPPASAADDVLAQRYARGEIDEEEFARRSEVLHSAPKPS